MRRYYFAIYLSLLPLFALAAIPEGYYNSAYGKKKADLKAAMKSIIGKANVLSYGSGSGSTWSGFYKTDRYDGNKVRDRYSNDERTFTNSTSAVSGMNIEHSFPKSWWGGSSNQAYKDLYNLMPCESTINSSKSNYAMGKVTTVSKNNGCTKVGKGTTSSGKTVNLWEPADKWKGDFARTYFYMVTSYSSLTWTSDGLNMLENDQWPTLQQWAYELLLQWSKDDPVDQIEIDRNEAVYAIQGNRNPFVDYPMLCEYIWGDSIDVAFMSSSGTGGGTTIDPETPVDPPVDPVDPVDPDNPDGPDEELDIDVILAEFDFKTSQEGWSIQDVTLPSDLTYVWKRDSIYGMKASAYAKTVKYATESWLISDEYDLSEMRKATITFEHTGKYFSNMTEEATLWIWTDSDEEWHQLPINTWMTGSDWTYVVNVTDLTDYCGEIVKFAFKYVSTEDSAPTWEIKNVKIEGTRQLVGDVNRDGEITLADVNLMREFLLQGNTGTCPEWIADTNYDDTFSISDLTTLIKMVTGTK